MKILAKPIEAAVFFIKDKEKPQPVKFRYCDDDGIEHTIKVGKVLVSDETKIAGIRAYKYLCQSEIDGSIKLYELKYLISDCRWELYKM